MHVGKVALVTGASRGIGAAIARRLTKEGLRTLLLGRARAELEQLAREVGGHPIVADVTDSAALLREVSNAERAVGPIDVLVHSAGTAEGAPLDKTSDAMWAHAMAVNATAAFVLCKALVPGMVTRGWGRVIHVASNAGLSGYAYTAAYCASKHAVVGLTRALAAEFARTGVTINAVCPGWVDTDMALRAVKNIATVTGRSEAEARRALEAQSPQRRFMTVEEVAHAVFALVPHEARGIHGQAISIDGGQVMS